jgi:nitrite reductase/ring-hydroxylating ferredoxin subunit
MKRVHLNVIQSVQNLTTKVMGRREALTTLVIGTVAACSSTTIEPLSNDAGVGGDDGGVGGGSDGTLAGDSGSGLRDSGSSGGDSGSGTCTTTPAGADVGPVSTFPSGTWKAAGSSNDPFIVGQDSGGYFAFTAICPHRGCQVDAPSSTGATVCPCHGAKFDGNGAVTKGPATTPLDHYAVAICNGHVYVDSSTTVPPSTRSN